ncbi:MAG: DUF956 family protein [Turicibacter sp.]|nr:DUF956 family protein [Turicibacter sp.]
MIRGKTEPVQAINTKVELVVNATSFMDLTAYGKIMIGDRGFEFYHDRDVRKYIQLPWEQIVRVKATVFLNGRWIPRFTVETKENGSFIFSAKQPKRVLGLVGKQIGAENIVHALGMWDVLKRAVKR